MKDFFISYNKADHDWAVWIDQQLRDAGYTTTIQAANMPPGSAFVHEMDKAVEENEGLIAVLSPDYLNSPYCESEWQAFYPKDPNGEKRALIPVRVRECQPKGLLAQRVYIDLAGKDGAEAGRILLGGVKAAREKLELPARYPVDDLLSVYLDQLRRKVSTVRNFGDDKPHELNEVFIELTLNEEYDYRPNQADFLGLMDAELRRMRSVFGDANQYRDREGTDDLENRGFAKTKRTIKPDELLRRHTHAIVTGAPGCGKTTLLRYLAWQTLKEFGVPLSAGSIRSQNKPSEGGTPNYRLPVFLELKELTTPDFQHAQSQLEHLLFNKAIATKIKPGEAEYDALKDRFLALLREGRVAIFLDGLDEVSGASFFKDLQRAVTDFLHSVYGANTAIISTRPFALRQFGNSKVMEIQPLNPRQIEQFIQHYYRDVPERQQFQRELQCRRELRELARVPALLGFILQLWRRRGSVADGKLDLYKQITRELAQHLDTDKEAVQPDRKWLVEDNDGSLKLDLLSQVAFNQLFKGFINPPYDIGSTDSDVNRLIFTSEQLRAEAAMFARTLKEHESFTINPRNLAEDVKATALLRQVGADHYAFAHLTLQEYLAACQLVKRYDADTCERIFCRAYFNPTLTETEVLPMTLGLVDGPDKFYEALERLPESLDLKGLRVRIRGLVYGAKLAHWLSERIIDRLVGFVVSVYPEESGYEDLIARSFLGLRGEQANLGVKKIGGLLKSENANQRAKAAEVLGKIGIEDAVNLLRDTLYDKELLVRWRAASSLAMIGGEKVWSVLVEALESNNDGVRESAINGIAEMGGEQALSVLTELLKDRNIFIRRGAAESLGEIGGEREVEALGAALRDEDVGVRIRAIVSLSRLGGSLAEAVLFEAAQKEDDPPTQLIIAGVLKQKASEKTSCRSSAGESDCGDKFPAELMEELTETPESVYAEEGTKQKNRANDEAIIADNNEKERIMGIILQSMKSKDSTERKSAVILLGAIGGERATGLLREILKDEDRHVREGAVHSLGRIGDWRAVTALQQALQDEHPTVRERAAAALMNISGEQIVITWIWALRAKYSDVRTKAAAALSNMENRELVKGLFGAITCEDKLVRKKAISVIAYYRNDGLLYRTLCERAEADRSGEVRQAAERAKLEFERKSQCFDTPILATTTDDYLAPGRPSPLTIQELAEMEMQIAIKYEEMLRGGDARQKGKALEELLEAIFSSVPGFSVSERNYHTTTEEIDLVVRNANSDPFWGAWGNLILVEAKHWRAQRVGKNEYVQFYRKMENRGGHCKLGFLICAERFAETFEKEMLRDSKFPLRVAPIDGEDLQRLVEAQDRSEILRGFVERALLT